MSTTVNYKGSTIATVKNATKTLTTSGKWLEGDIQLVDVTPGKYVATIKSTGSGGRYVRYDGTSYYTTGETFAYNAGDSLFITATDSMGGYGEIYIDDVRVVAAQGSARYTYTLPESNIDINFGSNSASVNTVPAFSLQSKSVSYTPTETAQSATVTADSGYDGLSSVAVSVGAISGTYVGSQVPTQAAQTIHPSTSAQTIASGKYLTGDQTIEAVTTANLTAANIVSGVTVKVGSATDDDCVVSVTGTATTGPDMPVFTEIWSNDWNTLISTTCNKTVRECLLYYNNGVLTALVISKNQADTEEYPSYAHVSAIGSSDITYTYCTSGIVPFADIKYNANGTIVETIPSLHYKTLNVTQNGTYYPEGMNYIAEVNVSVPATVPSLQSKSVSYTPSETAQSATVTADNGYDGLSSVDVSVGAISSSYVGSGIDRRSSSDLTASGATVTVPSGYYASQATKSVASGTEGTPTATKSSVSNHSVSVTPSVTNAAGYISGGTKTGTAVTVSASELVSGSETVTENGTVDVTNLASVVVNVPSSGGSTLGTKTITENGTFSASADGYDGYSSVTVNVPTGGGTGIRIGITDTPIPNILNMFYALENGTAKTGEFTLAQSIPNSSTLIFSTGLSTVHGIFIADESKSTLQTSTTPDNTLWAIVFNPTSNTGSYAMTRTTLGMAYGTNQTGVNRGFLNRVSAWEVTDGKLYATGSYNRNNNYTPFYPSHTYRWVAW